MSSVSEQDPPGVEVNAVAYGRGGPPSRREVLRFFALLGVSILGVTLVALLLPQSVPLVSRVLVGAAVVAVAWMLGILTWGLRERRRQRREIQERFGRAGAQRAE